MKIMRGDSTGKAKTIATGLAVNTSVLMPSNSRFDVLPVPVSGGVTAPAPADGYFLIQNNFSNSTSTRFRMENTISGFANDFTSAGGMFAAMLPVKKGTPMKVVYSGFSQPSAFVLLFFYADNVIAPTQRQVRFPVWVGNINGVEVEVNNDGYVEMRGLMAALLTSFTFPIVMRNTNYYFNLYPQRTELPNANTAEVGGNPLTTGFSNLSTALGSSGGWQNNSNLSWPTHWEVKGYANQSALSSMFPDLF